MLHIWEYRNRIFILYVKAEVHDVAVLHYVFFTFYFEQTSFAYSGFATEADIILILDYFGTNETALKVCVNHTGALGRLLTIGEAQSLSGST